MHRWILQKVPFPNRPRQKKLPSVLPTLGNPPAVVTRVCEPKLECVVDVRDLLSVAVPAGVVPIVFVFVFVFDMFDSSFILAVSPLLLLWLTGWD